jgi:hypothetical protein
MVSGGPLGNSRNSGPARAAPLTYWRRYRKRRKRARQQPETRANPILLRVDEIISSHFSVDAKDQLFLSPLMTANGSKAAVATRSPDVRLSSDSDGIADILQPPFGPQPDIQVTVITLPKGLRVYRRSVEVQ